MQPLICLGCVSGYLADGDLSKAALLVGHHGGFTATVVQKTRRPALPLH